jgi:two-component system response regulator CpxR
MTEISLLLVDDDHELTEVMTEYLSLKGFSVDVALDGASALQKLGAAAYDIVVLDVMLPVFSGFDVLERLRRDRSTPVIMLTARGSDIDRIHGLELGADDYLPKPFNPAELAARIRAILRRTTASPDTLARPLAVGPLQINASGLEARVHGQPLRLTGTEFRLLETLAKAAGQVQSRDQLAEKVLGRKLSAYDRSLDTHVSNLRRKLAQTSAGTGAVDIRSMRGLGYVLIASAEGPS